MAAHARSGDSGKSSERPSPSPCHVSAEVFERRPGLLCLLRGARRKTRLWNAVSNSATLFRSDRLNLSQCLHLVDSTYSLRVHIGDFSHLSLSFYSSHELGSHSSSANYQALRPKPMIIVVKTSSITLINLRNRILFTHQPKRIQIGLPRNTKSFRVSLTVLLCCTGTYARPFDHGSCV